MSVAFPRYYSTSRQDLLRLPCIDVVCSLSLSLRPVVYLHPSYGHALFGPWMDFLWRMKSALRRKVDLQASISQYNRAWGFEVLVRGVGSEVSGLAGLVRCKYELSSTSQNEGRGSRTWGF